MFRSGPERRALRAAWQQRRIALLNGVQGFRPGAYEPEGAPVWVPEPLPMLGQLWVAVEPEPVELELEPDDGLDDPEPVLVDPELPLLELDDGEDVDGFVVELVPELPVVVDVVAASATNAPPARSPEVSAPMANTLRRRICMVVLPFPFVCDTNPSGPALHTVLHGSEPHRNME